MHVLVDCDGVLGDFIETFLRMINSEYRTSLKKENIISYNLYECPDSPLKTREEERAAVRRFAELGLYGKLSPLPGAQIVLEKLAKNYVLDVVTHRSNVFKVQQETHAWIHQHYPGIFRNIFLVEGAKQQHVTKDTIAIIEDRPKNALEFAQANIDAILLDSPWNSEKQYPELLHPKIKRVKNWQEVEKLLRF